jgi:hypothetical protein
MSPYLDPRPAARYQAVTPTSFRQAMGARGAGAGEVRVAPSGSRVLRHVRTQVLRLAIAG